MNNRLKTAFSCKNQGGINFIDLFLLIFMIVGIRVSLHAQTVTWDGGGDKMSWSDPLNWDNDVLPTSNDTVVIQAAMVSLSGISPDPKISKLVIIQTELQVGQLIEIENADTNGIVLLNNSLLKNNGLIRLTVGGVGITLMDESQFINESEVEINGGTIGIYSAENTYLANEGSIRVEDSFGEGIHNLGEFENSHYIEIRHDEGYGIRCEGELANKASGRIRIDATSANSRGMYCDTLSGVINNGNVYLLKGSMRVLGQFVNYDTIVVDSAGGVLIGTHNDSLNIAKFHNMTTGYFSAGNSFGGGVFINYPDTMINEGTIVAYDQYCGGVTARGHFENFDTIICSQIMTCAGISVEHTAINHTTGFISVVDSPSFGAGLRVQGGQFDHFGHMHLEELNRPISNSGRLHVHAGAKIEVLQTSVADFLLSHFSYPNTYLIVEGELEIN